MGGATFATDQFGGEGGISLGNFINVSIYDKINGDFEEYALNNPLYLHEYGHYIDSQAFGLSYLFALGVPSAISANKAEEINNNSYGRDTHDFYWTEKRANKKAAKYFKRNYGIDWKTRKYKKGTYKNYYPLN